MLEMNLSKPNGAELELKADPTFVDFHVQVLLPRCLSSPCRCPTSSSPKRTPTSDPVSVPLTRAVVTNAVSCLNQRASASFTVHHDPPGTNIEAKLLTSTSSIDDAQIRATSSAAQQSPVSKLQSTGTASSETSRDTVIERRIESEQDFQSAEFSPAMVTTDVACIPPHATATVHNEQCGSVNELASSLNRPSVEPCPSITTLPTENASSSGLAPAQNRLRSTEEYVNTLLDSVERPMESPVEPEAIVIPHDTGVLQNKSGDPSSVITHRTGTPCEPAAATPKRLCTTPVSRPMTPASDRSHSVSATHDTDIQYRAVTVCAAGVAVALFLVVMRRLSFMLHGI